MTAAPLTPKIRTIMIIEQETRTVIKAEEGKVLVRKSDGRAVGSTVHLGYNYYEAGLQREVPKLMTPDDYEEVDAPAEEEKQPASDYPRMKQMASVIARERSAFSGRNLTASEMVEVRDLAPRWGIDTGKEGDRVKSGQKFWYAGTLYEVLQDHEVLPHYYPCENTAGLYKEVIAENNIT